MNTIEVTAGAELGATQATGTRWWVLRTKARQEKVVARNLEAAGLDFFLPVQVRKQPWGKGGREFALPLFPGYVFTRAQAGLTDRELGIDRVVQIIRVDDQARLHHELSQIRIAMNAGALLVPARYLERGTPVVVTAGPMKDVEGVVEGLAGVDRLYLQVHTLGRAVTVEISPTLIRAKD